MAFGILHAYNVSWLRHGFIGLGSSVSIVTTNLTTEDSWFDSRQQFFLYRKHPDSQPPSPLPSLLASDYQWHFLWGVKKWSCPFFSIKVSRLRMSWAIFFLTPMFCDMQSENVSFNFQISLSQSLCPLSPLWRAQNSIAEGLQDTSYLISVDAHRDDTRSSSRPSCQPSAMQRHKAVADLTHAISYLSSEITGGTRRKTRNLSWHVLPRDTNSR
jgi:hypothetical protein